MPELKYYEFRWYDEHGQEHAQVLSSTSEAVADVVAYKFAHEHGTGLYFLDEIEL